MPIAQWSSDLETGVRMVDEQHKELIRLVNDLHDKAASNLSKDSIQKAINFLSKYVVDHFKAEEKLMQESKYPSLSAHKKQHDDFLKDFTKLAKEFQTTSDTPMLSFIIKRLIVNWLVNHIMKTDKEMAKFLKLKGKVA